MKLRKYYAGRRDRETINLLVSFYEKKYNVYVPFFCHCEKLIEELKNRKNENLWGNELSL